MVGRQILRILSQGLSAFDETAEVNLTMSMASRSKSAATLLQRSLAISQYLTWAAKHAPPALPIDEDTLFKYFRGAEFVSRGATNGTRLLESLCFAHGVFGIDGSLASATSSRVKGMALEKHMSKAARTPAKELSDLQLFALEAYLADETNPIDLRLASGALCWMSYCRNRASDTYRLTSVELDRSPTNPRIGFIEASAQGTKKARSLALKLELMPVVGSISGLAVDSHGPWFDKFENARLQAGLSSLIDSDMSRCLAFHMIS